MIDNSAVVMILTNDVIKHVFKEVLKKRSVLFKELHESLSKTPELTPDEGRIQLEDAVRKLKEADLIKERTAPIEDFNSYYVTANGLTAERQLRL